MSLRGLLRTFGLKVGTISRGRFEQRIRELAAGNPMLEAATEPMLRARSALRRELAGLERHVRQLAQEDPVCLRLMSMPGIGAVVSLTYRSAVDDPARFPSSKKVGPWVGLTPSRNQSGERDISGGITKAGDMAEDLGGETCAPSWHQACDGCAGPAHRRGSAPHVEK